MVVQQEYELHILLPTGFGKVDKKYPVVYLMDSQWDFPLLKSLYGEQYYDGFIPEIIVVGVTWSGERPNADSLRARDYTLTAVERTPGGGGADKFLTFFRNELFPYIESNYRADPDKRVLMGCSLGGLFTLYTLYTQPDLFFGYIAASPALAWDNRILIQSEEKFARQVVSTPKRLYLTVGDVELSAATFRDFAKQISKRNYKNVSLESKILENTGHSGTKAETFARGLQYVFKRPSINVSASRLANYAGEYRSSGFGFTISMESNVLFLNFDSKNKVRLYALSDTEFYSNHEYFYIRFIEETGEVRRLELQRYGWTGVLEKQRPASTGVR